MVVEVVLAIKLIFPAELARKSIGALSMEPNE
jgi:hypothetical protein